MQYVEYGAHNSQTVILLHGGGLSWWNYRDAAQYLSEQYHVVLPILMSILAEVSWQLAVFPLAVRLLWKC